MRKMLLVGVAREASTRLKNKMTRPFADTSLFEIYLRKFEQIAAMDHPFSNIIMAVNKNDKTLWAMTKRSKIELAERDDFSVAPDTTGPVNIQNFLKNYKEDYVVNINGCCPFLKAETIIKIANYFKDNTQIKSLSCVRERFNHFWDYKTHRPINNSDPTCLKTQALTPLLENVNSLLVYSRDYMFKHNAYWDYTNDNPHLYVVPDDIECLDIDLPLEFKICETIWKENMQNAQSVS